MGKSSKREHSYNTWRGKERGVRKWRIGFKLKMKVRSTSSAVKDLDTVYPGEGFEEWKSTHRGILPGQQLCNNGINQANLLPP